MKKFALISLLTFSPLTSQAGDIIGNLEYGDTEDTVISKLQKSSLVSSNLDKSMFARVGVNGSFETTNTLSNMKFKLFFDWDLSGSDKKLTEVILRSAPQDITISNKAIKSAWKDATNLLTAMHGKPLASGEQPDFSNIPDGGIMYASYWKTDDGYVYLGAGMEANKLNLTICLRKNTMK